MAQRFCLMAALSLFLVGRAHSYVEPVAAPPADIAEAAIVVSFDKPEYFLGENIILHWSIENRGKKPFAIGMGGDYRGAARATRFKVTAVASNGKVVGDPYPGTYNMGGMALSSEVKPGAPYFDDITLMAYCRFDGPGTYTITVKHDLAWGSYKEVTPPVGKITVRLLMPTPEQARQVLEAMDKLPADPNRTFGKKGSDYRDYSTLRYPVYLPLMVERARRGLPEGMEALRGIATPEATKALIGLAANDNAIGLAAARTLALRLPIPDLNPKSPRQPGEWEMTRQWTAEQAWRPKFAPAVRAIARRLVAAPAEEQLRIGASILQAIGTGADLASLRGALAVRLEQTKQTPRVRAMQPFAPDPGWRLQDDCLALMRAATALRQRGVTLLTKPTEPADIALYLFLLANDKTYRPADRDVAVAGWMRHPLPFIRQLAVESWREPQREQDDTPVELPETALTALADLIGDSDPAVQSIAVHVAGTTRDARFGSPLLQALRTANGYWVIGSITSAAPRFGVQYEAWEIWAKRMAEPELTGAALNALRKVFKHGSHSGRTDLKMNMGAELQPKWEALLRDHRDELKAGQLLTPGQPGLPEGLFPPGFYLETPNGEWPKRAAP